MTLKEVAIKLMFMMDGTEFKVEYTSNSWVFLWTHGLDDLKFFHFNRYNIDKYDEMLKDIEKLIKAHKDNK